jgi:polyhydroxybutyrate depolymerase
MSLRRATFALAALVSGSLLAARPVRADHVLPVADRGPTERRPLLIYRHGLGGGGAQAVADPAVRGLAQRGRMFLVAPDGNVDHSGRRFWNASRACCNLDGKAVDDVARLEALIDHWRDRPEIDPARVYVVGFSNGGFMAHRLACEMDDRLAAIVSLAGAGRAREEACPIGASIAVLEVHGDADPIVRYQGGRVLDAHELDPHPSAPQTIADWADRLGCPPKAARKSSIDLDPRLPGAETTIAAQGKCARGTAELWTIHGAGHDIVGPEILAAHPKPGPGARPEPPVRSPNKKREMNAK